MTRREKITAYVPPDLADALRRLAAMKDKSLSDVVEDAIALGLSSARQNTDQAAIMAKLDVILRRVGAVERAQETHFELSAHAARFAMSMAPEISDQDRPTVNARGGDRFRILMETITRRLAAGRSVLRDQAAIDPAPPASAFAASATKDAP